MFTIQVDKTYQQIMKLFCRMGIWQSDDESHFRRIGKKLSYTFFSALFPIFFASNAFLCTDRSESILSVLVAIITSVIYVKFLYLLYKKPEILAFLSDQTVVHSIENHEEYDRMNEKIKKFIGFVRPYCVAVFATVPLLLVWKLPMFSADKTLPYFISFSWNDSEIIYWLAYMFLSLQTPLYVIANLFTPLVWYIMLNYSIEYELLGNKFRKLGMGKKTDGTRSKNQKNLIVSQRSMFDEDLIVLIKAHRKLAETIERCRSCFSALFLGQITTSSICICASAYCLAFASTENILQTEMYASMLLYGIFDIFLVTYLANEITVASNRLSYCLFESNWVERAESGKKYFLIMGEVLKQPQQLVILIYPMNLGTFMKTINGAYSMFNIIKNFK
ncbi:odorant receptor 94a-like [Bradysia coprophila]|uniref:odorant receptor 94a-like n=1 Tax=Bradysia coprophila TaxID=38358 RepID=UPI00187DCD08|nr:odorant receptor 94a-like [Bradysia coprophila]